MTWFNPIFLDLFDAVSIGNDAYLPGYIHGVYNPFTIKKMFKSCSLHEKHFRRWQNT